MTNNRVEYENIDDIDDKPTTATESVYLHPIFDDHDESQTNTPLLDDSNSDEQSPYEEVAASISNKDDPTMLCLTFRSVFLGIIFTCGSSFIGQFFAYRTFPLDITTGIIIILSYMTGKLLAKILPKKIFNLTLNPGPFTIKEHTLITIMATSSDGSGSIINVFTVERIYYKYYTNHFNALLLLISMHLLGLAISGILKRYLVWPASMIWPSCLMRCSLIRTLNNENDVDKSNGRWKMSRTTFFWLVVFFQFLWFWFPGYIFPLLSSFSFLCMIAPKNVVFSQITGANGLGIGAIQLDWNAWVAYLDTPILVPFWAHVNTFVGFIIVIWIVAPAIYYTNTWESQKLPIISNRVFDKDGYFYDPTKILNKDFRLNETAYQIYGNLQMTAIYAVSYSFIFAAFTSLIVHTILYHGKSIIKQFRSSLFDKENDIHARLMCHYPTVNEWWYYILLVFSILLAIIFGYTTNIMTIRIMFFAIIHNIISILPTGIILALTNMDTSSGVPGQLLSALILPGDPIGFLIFRIFTSVCQGQVLSFLSRYKIGHYMKIPDRILFFMFILCPILSSIVQYITAMYLLNHVPNICTPKNPVWKCLNTESIYTLSIMWGAIGSIKVFGPSSKYFPLLLALPIGLVLPLISWFLCKKYPENKWFPYIHFPIILVSTFSIPPAPAAEYVSWFLVGFFFNYILYRHAHIWWEKYAYIFSAAMNCGVAICGFAIFFMFQNNNIDFPKWWGTGGPTADGCPLAVANYSGFPPTSRDL